MSVVLEELIKRLEKLEGEVALLKELWRVQTIDEKQRREAGEAILRLGEQVGARLKGSNISLSDIVLQARSEW
ncbi:MAG: hypothetical protein SLRJCFUN_002063 [Candidatus Fervidibacter sp.]